LLYAHGEHGEALNWLDRCIEKSDDGFRGRIAAVLLDHPDERLRRSGADALARCRQSSDPPRVREPARRRLATFKAAVRRLSPFKPPGTRAASSILP
jgi:hypothetical protein